MLRRRHRNAAVSADRGARASLVFLASIDCVAAASELSSRTSPRYRGQVVVVDFWASWCKPCRQSIPWLNAHADAIRRTAGLVIIGVNVDAERARRRPLPARRSHRVSTSSIDPAGKLAERFDLQGMPSTFVFDRNGNTGRTPSRFS